MGSAPVETPVHGGVCADGSVSANAATSVIALESASEGIRNALSQVLDTSSFGQLLLMPSVSGNSMNKALWESVLV